MSGCRGVGVSEYRGAWRPCVPGGGALTPNPSPDPAGEGLFRLSGVATVPGPGDRPFVAAGLRMQRDFQKFFPPVISRVSRFLADWLTG